MLMSNSYWPVIHMPTAGISCRLWRLSTGQSPHLIEENNLQCQFMAIRYHSHLVSNR